MNRKLKLFFTAVTFFLAASGFSFAGERDYVIDTADFLSSAEVETIEEFSAYSTDIYGCGIYVALVDTYHPYSNIEDFAEAVFLEYDLGIGDEKNGVLLVVSVNEREYDICAHGSVGHYSFTDYGKKLIADSFLTDLRYNDWSSALIHFAQEAVVYLETAAEGEPVDVKSKTSEPMEQSEKIKLSLLIAAGISFLVALIICLVQKGNLISVKKAKNANSYVEMNKINLTQQADIFTHRTESRVKIETTSSSSGGGGTSVNSHGFSHSSGKF